MKTSSTTIPKWLVEFRKKIESMPNVVTELPEKSSRRIQREQELKQ